MKNAFTSILILTLVSTRGQNSSDHVSGYNITLSFDPQFFILFLSISQIRIVVLYHVAVTL